MEVKLNKRKALVAGSTGLIGNLLVQELVKSHIEVTALLRHSFPSKNKLISYEVVNFDELQSSESLFDEVTDVYICLGTTIKKAGSKEAFMKVDIDYCVAVAKAASKAKIPNLSIVTSVGADPESKNFYLKCKGEVEKQISNLSFDSLSIYRPGLLIGPREEKRAAEAFGQWLQPNLIDPLLLGSAKKYRSVKASDLAVTIKEFSGLESGKSIYHFQDFLKR